MGSETYDVIGRGYSAMRRPDPRLERRLRDALGSARSVVNVGAGTGSYEPTDIEVVALEPSGEMIAQRPPGAAEVLRAAAESLPLEDDSVDAAMTVFSVHHWRDPEAGIVEMRWVARRRVVVLTFDPGSLQSWWISEYAPEIGKDDLHRFPSIEQLRHWLGGAEVEALEVPAGRLHRPLPGVAVGETRAGPRSPGPRLDLRFRAAGPGDRAPRGLPAARRP